MARRPALDGLRGLAILLVAAGHLRVPGLDSGGWPGVTLFFVLSGFLITRILLGDHDLRHFYERRIRRLIPALVLFLAFMIGWLWGRAGLVGSITSVVLYVSNWTGIATWNDGSLAHLWSLAVEEQFYIVWPLTLILLLRVMRPAYVLRVVLVAAALSAVLRLYPGFDLERAYVGTDTRADALLMGCALALAFHTGWTWRPARPLVFVSALVVLACAMPTGTGQEAFAPAELAIGLPLTALAGVVLVAYAYSGSPVLSFAPLQWFGRISYGLYLWHSPLIILAGMKGFIAAIAIASASWWFVERPLLGRREVATHPELDQRRTLIYSE